MGRRQQYAIRRIRYGVIITVVLASSGLLYGFLTGNQEIVRSSLFPLVFVGGILGGRKLGRLECHEIE